MTRFRPRVFAQGGDSPTAQEERVAQQLGGRRNRGSGSSIYAKGDVRVDRAGILLECKRTEHASLSLKKAWLDKICREAAAAGREPALAIEIAGGPDDAHGHREWVCIPLSLFRQLLGDVL